MVLLKQNKAASSNSDDLSTDSFIFVNLNVRSLSFERHQ